MATWLPVSGIVASSTLVADRYTYLPAVGLGLVVGDWVMRPQLKARRWALGAVAMYIAFCALWTPSRVAVWSDSSSLWSDALRENPRNPFAHNQLSVANLDAGCYGEAAAFAFDAARHGFARPGYLFNLCLAFRGLEDRQRELDTARTILEGDPGFVPARTVVLRQLAEDGRHAECEQMLVRLLADQPEEPGLVAAQAYLEERRGRIEPALLLYLRSVELRPGDPEVLLAVAVLLARCGDVERALKAAASTVALHGALSPGARARFRELAAVAEERAGPQAGDFVRELYRQAIAGA
jgi:tetratricopeptide (TPR) repeat protein